MHCNYNSLLYILFIFEFNLQIEDFYKEQFEILDLDKFKHFKISVASQMIHKIYDQLSICDNIGLTFAIHTNGVRLVMLGSLYVRSASLLMSRERFIGHAKPLERIMVFYTSSNNENRGKVS